MNDPNDYHCIDRLNCRFFDCRFHIICMKYHEQRDAERRYRDGAITRFHQHGYTLTDKEVVDAYIDRLDDENARLLKVRGA